MRGNHEQASSPCELNPPAGHKLIAFSRLRHNIRFAAHFGRARGDQLDLHGQCP